MTLVLVNHLVDLFSSVGPLGHRDSTRDWNFQPSPPVEASAGHTGDRGDNEPVNSSHEQKREKLPTNTTQHITIQHNTTQL